MINRKKIFLVIIVVAIILGITVYFLFFRNTAYKEKFLLDVNHKEQDVKTAEPDTNGDGILDSQAKTMGLNPNLTDNDGDGIFDVDEINTTKTDPLKVDTDGDGFNDLEELRSGYNPNGPGKLTK
ncbi:MAG: hypothetical protein PHT51_02560 [Patescibacteria group bacterium]|nr:hypothetical protein [Patescibacteria group bacterium]